MRLAFYSDQIVPQNRRVDAAVARLLPPAARIGYIPSAPEPDRRWFEERRRYDEAAGWTLEAFHEPEDDDPAGLASLLACDAVHLSGGDTRAFRLLLERAGLMPVLRRWAEGGGLVIGTSAGGIVMTPTSALDAVYRGQDPRAERALDYFGLVDFDFYPHAAPDAAHFVALVCYSEATEATILGCPDGPGIVIDGPGVASIGPGDRIEAGTATGW